MAKIGRNTLCPCGSGKKYKRCCLVAPKLMPTTAPSKSHDDDLCDCCLDDLNDRADQALDLLLDNHVDEAEEIAQQLMRDFPQEVEGVDLLSMVYEARGDRGRAIEHLREALAIAHSHPHLDVETKTLMRERLRELEQRA